MFPASVKGPGQSICFPDVCLTPPAPPAPVPYVNIGLHSVASATSTIVNVCAMPALNILSFLPNTMGDEAGSMGGIKSGTISGPGYFLSGSPIVFIEKLPAVRLTSRASGNTENAQGAVLIPGQPIVYFAFDPESAAERVFDGAPFPTHLESKDTGVVLIDRFARDSVRLFFNAQRALVAEGARSFVIDLRGCPGGDLEAAYALAAEFLPEGSALGTVIDADGDVSTRVAHRDGPYGFPLVVLVDRATKSAAEVFAGALAHHGRATLVGEATFGKATVQRAGHGGGVLETCARVELPSGLCFPILPVPAEGSAPPAATRPAPR
jgi:carboxyl-terminal processing protease